MTKLDDRTVVPLTWLVGGFAAGLAPVIAAVFWIASVNFRLQRIEEKLGIPPYRSGSLLPGTDAYAEGGKDDAERVPRPIHKLQSNN